jgi:hypothetical protein
MKSIFQINKILILVLLSIGAVSTSSAALFDDWTDNQLCEWMDQAISPGPINAQVMKRNITCSKGIAAVRIVKKVGEAANSHDGAYACIIKTESAVGQENIGTAQFIIKDGKISVARKYRYLMTSAISSYDTFEGVIDKEGNMKASFEFNPIRHMVKPMKIKFSGDIDSLQLRGRFDAIKSWDNTTKEYVLDENFYPSFYDVIIDFKKEKY